MNISRLVVEECEGFEPPCGAGLPAIGNFLEIGFVFLLEFGNAQAMLLSDFRLQNDLYFLRRYLVSIVWVRVVREIIANDLELDLG